MSSPVFDERAARFYFKQLIIFLSKPPPPTLSTDFRWRHALDHTVQAQLSWVQLFKIHPNIQDLELYSKNFEAARDGTRIGKLLYEHASKVNVMIIDREGGEDLREVIIEKHIPHILHFNNPARSYEEERNPFATELHFYEAAKKGWMLAKLAEEEMKAMAKEGREWKWKRKRSTSLASGKGFLRDGKRNPDCKRARPWEL